MITDGLQFGEAIANHNINYRQTQNNDLVFYSHTTRVSLANYMASSNTQVLHAHRFLSINSLSKKPTCLVCISLEKLAIYST